MNIFHLLCPPPAGESKCNLITPKALNMDNPVQAEGAARGRENRRQHRNSVGVQHLSVSCCAPTEHRVGTLHHQAPRCARGYPYFTPAAWRHHSDQKEKFQIIKFDYL
jgi:hypothetical protein